MKHNAFMQDLQNPWDSFDCRSETLLRTFIAPLGTHAFLLYTVGNAINCIVRWKFGVVRVLDSVAAPLPDGFQIGFYSSGVSVNPHVILTIDAISCFAFQPAAQRRSKYGPTLKASFVVLPVITLKPLQLSYAHHKPFAGVIRLNACLARLEHRASTGISDPISPICHRMPLAIPQVPIKCPCLLLPFWRWPSHNK